MKVQINNLTINISERILDLLKSYIQNKKQNESGGIILGKIDEDGEAFIEKLSLPNDFDSSSRNGFERDKRIAKIIIDYEFYNSQGKVIYLGEWHTHPERIPSPSDVDIKMIKEQYKKNRINVDFLVILIQGTEQLFIGVYDGSKIQECVASTI